MRKRFIAALIAMALPCSAVAHAQSDEEGDFINPPINPLPSVFSVSIDGNNEVPDIPPPINPLPAREVYIQTSTKKSTSSTSPTFKNTQHATTKKPKKKTVTVTKRGVSGSKNASVKKTTSTPKPKKKTSQPKATSSTKKPKPSQTRPKTVQPRQSNGGGYTTYQYPPTGYSYQYKTDGNGNITSSTRTTW